MLRKIGFLICFFILSGVTGCSQNSEERVLEQLKVRTKTPETVSIFHMEEVKNGILVLYKDSSGFRHAFFNDKLQFAGGSGNADLQPTNGLSFTMSNDPNIPLLVFSGVISNLEIDNVIVKQKITEQKAKILNTANTNRVWFTTFEHLEAGVSPDPLKIEAISKDGKVLWEFK